MSKVQRKSVEERSKEIRDSARVVFLKKGYRKTTMKDIVDQTSLSQGGVYKYYATPKSILLDIMREGNKAILEEVRYLESQLDQGMPFDEVMVTLTLKKLFTPKQDKRLFAMFLSEVIYDEEMACLFYALENEFKQHVVKIISKRHSAFDEAKYLLLSRISNAILFSDQVFKKKDCFSQNQDKIAKMLRLLYGSSE